MSVYFCFQGDLDQNMADVNVCIDRNALEGVKESVLTKLADDSWKTNEAAGTTEDQPIVTKPLESPCKNEWDPSLAYMIADAYRYHQEKKEWENMSRDDDAMDTSKEPPARLNLPTSNNIELEDASIVLDYYGLDIDESADVDFSKSSDDVRIRALLFIKWMKAVAEAKSFIIETLERDPKVVTLFLFANSKHDMEFINKKTNNEKETFVRVGGEDECDVHHEWVENARLRAGLVSMVEEESGLKARFMRENYYNGEPNPYPQTGEESLLCVRQEYDQYEGLESMRVLEVTVPVKRQRY